MRIEPPVRKGLTTIMSAALLTISAYACASEPKLRPTALDPAGPASGAEHGHDHGSNASSDKDKSVEAGRAGKPKATVYTCPMHPEVTADKEGRCPKCGMKLVPKEQAEGKK